MKVDNPIPSIRRYILSRGFSDDIQAEIFQEFMTKSLFPEAGLISLPDLCDLFEETRCAKDLETHLTLLHKISVDAILEGYETTLGTSGTSVGLHLRFHSQVLMFNITDDLNIQMVANGTVSSLTFAELKAFDLKSY